MMSAREAKKIMQSNNELTNREIDRLKNIELSIADAAKKGKSSICCMRGNVSIRMQCELKKNGYCVSVDGYIIRIEW